MLIENLKNVEKTIDSKSQNSEKIENSNFIEIYL